VPSCAEGGVLGILPGVVGTLQATETIKLILGKGYPLIGRLLLFDALQMAFRELKIQKNPDCPICGCNPSITSLIDYETFCNVSTGSVDESADISAVELKHLIDRAAGTKLIDVREPGVASSFQSTKSKTE
jgi:adenylyltransferase/sulfurtransferase